MTHYTLNDIFEIYAKDTYEFAQKIGITTNFRDMSICEVIQEMYTEEFLLYIINKYGLHTI